MTSLPWKSIALVLTGIGLGCGAGAVGRAVAQLPPPPPGVQHYQYTCQDKVNARVWEPDVQSYLNQMGAQGWRLLPSRFAGANPGSNYMDIYCFERAVP
jgi:hypothetical protein